MYGSEMILLLRFIVGYIAECTTKKLIIMILLHYVISLLLGSFLDLVPYLFSIPGVKAFLSEELCQDPLEKFFGCQRQRGRVNENPNCQDFCKNTQALRVVNSFVGPVKGNCRGNKTEAKINTDKENKPLPKRRYLRKV